MQEFELKQEHLKLLKKMKMEWDSMDFGAPRFNSKRPFGNSCGIEREIADIVGTQPKNPKEGLSDDECRDLRKLYDGTYQTLQILISNAETGVKLGIYVTNDGRKWQYKGPAEIKPSNLSPAESKPSQDSQSS